MEFSSTWMLPQKYFTFQPNKSMFLQPKQVKTTSGGNPGEGIYLSDRVLQGVMGERVTKPTLHIGIATTDLNFKVYT